jgi:hypothetical protein
MHIFRSLIAAFALAFSSLATAALISVDDVTLGADSITRDTLSGLEWLDINLTFHTSSLDINSQLSSGGLYDGFRRATTTELIAFLDHAGV